MKVLVLGGTGAMGVHLVELLASHAQRVVVTSRSKAAHIGNIQYVTGNARDQSFVSNLLNETWDAIIDFMVYPTQEFRQRYPLFLRATGHYIYLSSARVYAQSATPLTENSPRLLDVSSDSQYLATDEYALSKARQENLLFDAASGNWTIVRPYITYSDERLQLGVQEKEDWLYRALQGGTLVDCADIQSKRTTLTFGLDVASGINALVGKPGALGEAFHITADQPVLWSQVLDTYLQVLHARLGQRPRISLQPLDDFMRWRQGKYQILYDRLYNRDFDNRKIRLFIDTAGFKEPLRGLAECLEQFLAAPEPRFKPINWRAEAIKDRLLGEYTPSQSLPGLKAAAKYSLFRHTPIAALLPKK
jgi:nucleoside-diphosphate-sugar epimerase